MSERLDGFKTWVKNFWASLNDFVKGVIVGTALGTIITAVFCFTR